MRRKLSVSCRVSRWSPGHYPGTSFFLPLHYGTHPRSEGYAAYRPERGSREGEVCRLHAVRGNVRRGDLCSPRKALRRKVGDEGRKEDTFPHCCEGGRIP